MADSHSWIRGEWMVATDHDSLLICHDEEQRPSHPLSVPIMTTSVHACDGRLPAISG